MAGEGNWYDLRVYVGNIGRYNEGSLVGGWTTLPMGRDDLDAFLRDRVGIDGERYEEYRIDDFDLPDWLPAGPGERVVDERTSLEDLNVMAGVLSTLDEDDAAKARIWIEEGMSPAGRLSPLVFANVALQADDIPFYAYEAGTRFDPGVSSNEEAFALTAAENDPELAEALDGLPAYKMHCSVLAEEAIKAAVKDYYDKHGIAYDESKFPDCSHCDHCEA